MITPAKMLWPPLGDLCWHGGAKKQKERIAGPEGEWTERSRWRER